MVPDKASQRQALGILRRAQRNCAAIVCPGTVSRLRVAWGWEEEDDDDELEEGGWGVEVGWLGLITLDGDSVW